MIKKALFLGVIFGLLFNLTLAYGMEIESLAIPGYKMELPDDAKMPNRSVFVSAGTRDNPQEPDMTLYLWKKPGVSYYDDVTGKFTYPYIEITYILGEKTFIITIAFINKDLKNEAYASEVLFGGSQMTKFISLGPSDRIFREVME